MQEDSVEQKFTRRQFLKLAGVAAAGLVDWRFKLNRFSVSSAPVKEKKEQVALSRKEAFRPFNRGPAEWQYVAFQYQANDGKRFGVVTSMTEVRNSQSGETFCRFLVMKHDLETGVTNQHVYSGQRVFDEATSTYRFMDGEKQLAQLSYLEDEDEYSLGVQTDEFSTQEIDQNGLRLSPQGNLILESKDGNFPIAQYPEGRLVTNYYTDNVCVTTQTSGEVVGYGRRDSENIEIETGDQVEAVAQGTRDFDHTWVHAGVGLSDGRRAFVTAWKATTGGNFQFATIERETASGSGVYKTTQYNEEDPSFAVRFESNPSDYEDIDTSGEGTRWRVARSGKVVATLGDQELFAINVQSKPGQIIDDQTELLGRMVEAHGVVTSGRVLGDAVRESLTSTWETTDERSFVYLPLAMKQ